MVTSFSPQPSAVPFDAKRLRDAVGNIVANAIKYSPQGGTVAIHTHYHDNHAIVTISDTGIGVEAGQEDKIFQKFTRLKNAEQIDPNGSGLGLYISKKIIEKHGGEITYTHNQPTGSVFTITLPCYDACTVAQ
jgi:signal transduction histidine kinase